MVKRFFMGPSGYTASSARLLLQLPSFQRKLFLSGLDAIAIVLSVWLSIWLRLSHPFPIELAGLAWLLIAAPLLGLSIYALTANYRSLTRYTGSLSIYRLAFRNALLVLSLAMIGLLFRLPLPPRSSWVLLWLLVTILTGSLRFVLRDLLLFIGRVRRGEALRVVIYGAGSAGVQLAHALTNSVSHRISFFVDDSPLLWNREINGVPIVPPQVLHEQAASVDQVLLAIPSLSRSQRRHIVDAMQSLDLPVLQVPSIVDITSGLARIDALRPIAIEDLLGRDPVLPDPGLLRAGIEGRSVCVTGAGGSIGSELCRQILRLSPRLLILLERSEASLYYLHRELTPLLPASTQLLPVLGSAGDFPLVEALLREQAVEVVFHAAAYKHVPLVEANPLAALANNVCSSRVLCSAAACSGVDLVLLISTDKAVRPTSVMGASKRLAELVMQAAAQEESGTRFAMVRFGNVLGSSGSVVPLFRSQIEAGGPVTLTHPEIIRYFMTIPEAAQLLLQSAVLAESGDLLLLDMGEPVRIKALAEQMVRLSGLSLRNAARPDGDIEILCTGLRPGEKLYEELLIDADSEPTAHPLIYRAREQFLPADQLWPQLDALERAIANHDISLCLDLLTCLVPEWQRDGDASTG